MPREPKPPREHKPRPKGRPRNPRLQPGEESQDLNARRRRIMAQRKEQGITSPHSCDFPGCGAHLEDAGAAQRHAKDHQREEREKYGDKKSFQRIICREEACDSPARIFGSVAPANARTHYNSVHLGKKHTCGICGQKLCDESGLLRHSARVHGISGAALETTQGDHDVQEDEHEDQPGAGSNHVVWEQTSAVGVHNEPQPGPSNVLAAAFEEVPWKQDVYNAACYEGQRRELSSLPLAATSSSGADASTARVYSPCHAFHDDRCQPVASTSTRDYATVASSSAESYTAPISRSTHAYTSPAYLTQYHTGAAPGTNLPANSIVPSARNEQLALFPDGGAYLAFPSNDQHVYTYSSSSTFSNLPTPALTNTSASTPALEQGPLPTPEQADQILADYRALLGPPPLDDEAEVSHHGGLDPLDVADILASGMSGEDCAVLIALLNGTPYTEREETSGGMLFDHTRTTSSLPVMGSFEHLRGFESVDDLLR